MPKTTKRAVRCRFFCFTENNPTKHYDWEELKGKGARYLIYQKEVGKDATEAKEHFQGYIEFNQPITIRTLSRFLGGRTHNERAFSPDDARDYCLKDNTRLEGPWEYGKRTTQGHRTDLELFRDAIAEGVGDSDLLELHTKEIARYPKFIDFVRNALQIPRSTPPEVIVLMGPTGCGKSWTARHSADNLGLDIHTQDPESQWWSGYVNQKAVIIDEFAGQISFRSLNMLLDRYPHKVAVKGSYREFNSTHIFITTNIHPRRWYQDLSSSLVDTFMRRISHLFVYSDKTHTFVEEEIKKPNPVLEVPPLILLDGSSLFGAPSSISQSSEESLEQSSSPPPGVPSPLAPIELGDSLLQEDP